MTARPPKLLPPLLPLHQPSLLSTHNAGDEVATVVSPPSKIGFAAALATALAGGLLLRYLVEEAIGSTPGANGAHLANLLLPTLINVFAAWQLGRWAHHVPLGCGSHGTRKRAAVQVLPTRRTSEFRAAILRVERANQLRPAYEKLTPPPIIAPAGEPDARFLARCAAAAAALASRMMAAGAEHASMVERLGEHYHLRWKGSAGVARAAMEEAAGLAAAVCDANSSDSNDAGLPPSFGATAKALHLLAMRYPSSTLPLAQGNFEWVTPPLRAGGEAALQHALRVWTERTRSAADSALFSSMGAWISPFGVWMFAQLSIAWIILMWLEIATGHARIHPANAFGNAMHGIGMGVVAWLLRAGRRDAARSMYAATYVGVAVSLALEVVFSSCQCVGPYTETHTEGGSMATRDYSWQWTWYMCVLTVLCVCLVGGATHPHRTFSLYFICCPLLFILAVAPMTISNYQKYRDVIDIDSVLCAVILALGVFLWTGRAHALAEARHLAVEDAARYIRLWERQLLPSKGFHEALHSLGIAWRKVQSAALRLPKRQLSAPSLYALFVQADELNDLLQAKIYDIVATHGGIHHASGVKTEARALQKVFRTYEGDWRRLGDLCRTSVVFETVPQLEACLRVIAADSELEVIAAGDEKMRLREDFDAATLSGGYRDIQLCVRLNTAETRVRGVHEHLAEVQLHFAPIFALKSDGGHKNYVLRRNLGGQ